MSSNVSAYRLLGNVAIVWLESMLLVGRSRVHLAARLSCLKICKVFSFPKDKFQDITLAMTGFFYILNN
jgi:hypothetical protein